MQRQRVARWHGSLGQMSDPTAIAVLERWDEPTGELDRATREQTRRRYAVRLLERLPLGTSYVDVVDHIFSLVRQWNQLGNYEVILDATGGDRDCFNIDRVYVPKRDPIQGLAILLESCNVLVEQAHRARTAANSRTSAGTPHPAAREHDDPVVAVALATFPLKIPRCLRPLLRSLGEWRRSRRIPELGGQKSVSGWGEGRELRRVA